MSGSRTEAAGLPGVDRLITWALEEDVGSGDATTLALVPETARSEAVLVAKSDLVVCGLDVAAAVFQRLDPTLTIEILIEDGADAGAGDVVARYAGPSRALLTAERTALNFMQRLSGIATLTRTFTDAVAGLEVMILDTRKTTPGYRALEKYAVQCGGGANHRMGLYDRVMIKDNHRRLWAGGDPTRLDLAIREARRRFPGLAVEVEVESLTELESALREKPEWVLLDNLSAADMVPYVERCAGISRTEASGGIDLTTVRAAAESGVDAISLGCLTHSAPSADLSLEVL